MSDSTELKTNKDRPTPLKIIADLFEYYRGREYSLVQLLYKKGATGYEVANALGIHPGVVSRNYPQHPRGGSK